MKLVVQYFCNPLIKKKQLTSYPLSTLIWLFVDLQKTFDTEDHQILLAKLNCYGIHRVSNDWLNTLATKEEMKNNSKISYTIKKISQLFS